MSAVAESAGRVAGIPSLLGPPLRHSEMVSDEQQQMDPDCFLPALVLAPPPAITARRSTGVSALRPRENMQVDHTYNFCVISVSFCMLSTIKFMTHGDGYVIEQEKKFRKA